MIGCTNAENFFELAISMPIGRATTTAQNHPIMTREMDSQQFAHRVPSLAIEAILFTTAVGVGRKISLTLPEYEARHQIRMIRQKQISDSS